MCVYILIGTLVSFCLPKGGSFVPLLPPLDPPLRFNCQRIAILRLQRMAILPVVYDAMLDVVFFPTGTDK